MKVVTTENWLSPDPTTLLVSQFQPGRVSDLVALVNVGNYLAERFTEIRPSSATSEDVMRLFTVAKGAVIYGVFFYPLLELGLSRAYTAVEVATKECFLAHGGPKRTRNSHAKRIDWLCEFGWISRELCALLHGMREVRNYATHENQTILMPISVSRDLHHMADYITRIAEERDSPSPRHEVTMPEHDHRKFPWQ